jgi:HSP90 family molecular chaperone
MGSNKKILELNPNHPIVKELLDRVKDSESSVDKDTEDYAKMMTETALVNSGYSINNP